MEQDCERAIDSPLPADSDRVLLVEEIPTEEIDLMPISSGFGYYPYNYPTTITDRVLPARRLKQQGPKVKLSLSMFVAHRDRFRFIGGVKRRGFIFVLSKEEKALART